MRTSFLPLLAALAVVGAGFGAVALAQAPKAGGPHGGQGPKGAAFGLLEMDANADGKLTKAEFDAGVAARFNAIDADRNGVATAEERKAAQKAQKERMRAAMEAKGEAPEGQGRRAGRDGERGPRGDRGGDIAKADFTARHAQMFTRLDADKDNVVTIAEMQAARPDR
jgi:hypothetical protein